MVRQLALASGGLLFDGTVAFLLRGEYCHWYTFGNGVA